jgi:DNA-binding XRE family transcriptional regulator
MHRFGRNPDEARREQVAMLRATGLTFTNIGKRLGISRQCAHVLFQSTGKVVRLPGIHCRECKKEIVPWNPKWRGGMRGGPPVYCLRCLTKHPEAALGERLTAFRINAGLTRPELAQKAGIRFSIIVLRESGKTSPRWSELKRLVGLFGTGLLDLSDHKGNK